MDIRITSPEERRANLLLWVVVLGGPAIASLQLLLVYLLSNWACQHLSEWWLHVASGVAIAAGIAIALLSYYIWRTAKAADPPPMPRSFLQCHCHPRVLFMAMVGLFSGVLFCLIILAMSLPPLLLEPCYP